MAIDIKDDDKDVVCHALNVYLSDLQTEIGKTENHNMKSSLHREKDVIQTIVSQC